MWIKYPVLPILFWMLALLQASFFSGLHILGAVPNLVFILLFCLVFFSEQKFWEYILWAVVAGFFLDIYSSFYFGISIIALLIVCYIERYFIGLLRRLSEKYPLVYFVPMFIICLVGYNLVLFGFSCLTGTCWWSVSGKLFYVPEIIINIIFALGFYFVFKKLNKNEV